MRDLVIKRLLRRTGKNGTGDLVVYLRNQTVWDGIRYPYFEVSTKIRIPNPKQWDMKAQRVKGNSKEVRELNKKIQDKEDAVGAYWKKFSVNSNIFDFNRHRKTVNALLGGKNAGKPDLQEPVYIIDLFDRHIENGKPKGGEFDEKRKGRYMFIKKQVGAYCLQKYKTEKVGLDALGKPFYLGFRRYLQKQLILKQNTLQGYMNVIEAAVNSEWERGDYNTKNPFTGCDTEGGKSKRVALTLTELNCIKALPDHVLGESAALARDIFLFAAYTGISYCDLKALTTDYILLLEGEEYLVKDREKNRNHVNSNFFSVPISDDIKALLNKFRTHPRIAGTDRLIPMTSNSDYNKELKIIRARAGIKKPLSAHIARHTMACLFLEGGGSMEVLMKLLGHSRLSQTQEYGKMTPVRVSQEARNAQKYISSRDAKIIPINCSTKQEVGDGVQAIGG